MKRTKLAVIGANGRVGTELCCHLREEADVELVPIVRNVLGAAFLDHHGFECRVGDIADEAVAKRLLHDVDVVVISAYASMDGSCSGREAIEMNCSIIDNSVRFSDAEGLVIYFSTIRAFSGRVDTNTPRLGIPGFYDRSKRLLERRLLTACSRASKRGIALRLGHVYGKGQPRTKELVDTISRHAKLKVLVDRSAASNVVHVNTIKDCIMVCRNSKVRSGLYSLTNSPQWSWGDVFDFYNPDGADLVFERKRPPSLKRQVISRFWSEISARRQTIGRLRQFFPSELHDRLLRRYTVRSVKAEIDRLEETNGTILEMNEFAYREMPGEVVPGLSNTRALLQGETSAGVRIWRL